MHLLEILEGFSAKTARAVKQTRLSPLERRLQRALAAYWRRQGRDFLAALSTHREIFGESLLREVSEDQWAFYYDEVREHGHPALLKVLHSVIPAAFLAGAKEHSRAAVDLPRDFSAVELWNPRAAEFMRAHGADLVSNIDETTRGNLRTILTTGTEEGWSYERIARAIKARYSGFAIGNPLEHIASRAELVSVTELAFAYEQGNAAVAEEIASAGLVMQKSWLTVNDDHVDEEQCGPNEDEGWIPLDDSFQDGSDEPPAHPGCRCTVLYQSVASQVAA